MEYIIGEEPYKYMAKVRDRLNFECYVWREIVHPETKEARMGWKSLGCYAQSLDNCMRIFFEDAQKRDAVKRRKKIDYIEGAEDIIAHMEAIKKTLMSVKVKPADTDPVIEFEEAEVEIPEKGEPVKKPSKPRKKAATKKKEAAE